MKRWLVKDSFVKGLTSWLILSILVFGIGIFFIYKEKLIGPAYVVLAFLTLGVMRLFGISLKSVYPDMVFGFIDNAILIIFSVVGGIFAGIAGAVLGGAAGNTISDGLGGLFEGRIAEKLRRQELHQSRTPISTMMGKVVGCLLGAGVGFILMSFIKTVF